MVRCLPGPGERPYNRLNLARNPGPMILTCPSCTTRYMVDPTKLGSDGRFVRGVFGGAVSCHVWLHFPQRTKRPSEPSFVGSTM